jgi:hypothetical protein
MTQAEIIRKYLKDHPEITSPQVLADFILKENPEIKTDRDALRGRISKIVHAGKKRSLRDIYEQGFKNVGTRKNLPKLRDEKENTNQFTFEQSGEEATAESQKSKRIVSLDDLIEFAKIDQDEWIIERHVINKWEVGAKLEIKDDKGKIISSQLVTEPLFQVKAWLKKNKEFDFKQFQKDLIADIKEYIPPVLNINRNIKEGHDTMAQINIFDAHIDKLCWWEESGDNYDTKISIARFNEAVEDLIIKASIFKPEQILLPIGNDFFNTNNDMNTTKRGTKQDVDSRDKNSFRKGVNLLRQTIDKLTQIAPVMAPVIRGNHDEDKAWYLGEVLAAIYDNNQNVTIDNGARNRKYVQYYDCLIGLTHGDKEKIKELQSIMAAEVPHLWGATRYREFHIGHIHHEKTLELKGCTVRSMRSISGTDTWHSDAGYVGSVKSAECFIWQRHSGLIGNFYKNF